MKDLKAKARKNQSVPGPLHGWRIIVSRAKKQAGTLSTMLREAGAEVSEIPFIEIRPPRSYRPLDIALNRLAEYDWVVLTSANGVEALLARMKKHGLSARDLMQVNVAAIGTATRGALENNGVRVSVMPREYVAESMVEAMAERVKGKRVLLCRAHVARDVIPREFRKLGATVDVADAYETVLPRSSRVRLKTALMNEKKRPHIITFTSASTVQNYISLLGIRSGTSKLIRGVHNASIGPVTSDALRAHGLTVDAQADPSTMAGLVAAILKMVEKNRYAPAEARIAAALK